MKVVHNRAADLNFILFSATFFAHFDKRLKPVLPASSLPFERVIILGGIWRLNLHNEGSGMWLHTAGWGRAAFLIVLECQLKASGSYAWLCIGLEPAYFLAFFWRTKNALCQHHFRTFCWSRRREVQPLSLWAHVCPLLTWKASDNELSNHGPMRSAWPFGQISEGPAGHCGIDRHPSISTAAVSAVLNLEVLRSVVQGLIQPLDTLCQFSTSETSRSCNINLQLL